MRGVYMGQINVKLNDDDKVKAMEALREMGLTMSSAIQMFIAKVARERRIPFEVCADPFYSESNMNELRKRIENVKSGKSMLKEHELLVEDDDEENLD